jgi:hypothetical protein
MEIPPRLTIACHMKTLWNTRVQVATESDVEHPGGTEFEVAGGIEPPWKVLQTRASPLGYTTVMQY